MNIEIRRLTPDLAEDYARFFDLTPHNIHTNSGKCYCVTWRSDDSYVGNGDHWFSSCEERRARAIQFVRDGSLQGYLAYQGDEIVGWCNANGNCQLCVNYLRSSWPIPEYQANIKIKSIFCFVIAPGMQRKGIATQLLNRVCTDAAKEGYDFAEAYVDKVLIDISDDFRGYLAMYEKCGFSKFAEREGKIVVRKALRVGRDDMSDKSKDYPYKIGVRDDDALRSSFNALTRQTFGFDFEDWYTSGHWGDWYIPHVMLDGDKVVSNVSVNLMRFDVNGTTKNYIQLGTVMTDEAYRGQGLNRQIMERVLAEYAGKVDGIYLFGNDDVVNYYPKFGFRPAKEYEYYLEIGQNGVKTGKCNGAAPYQIQPVDINVPAQAEKLYAFIREYPDCSPAGEEDVSATADDGQNQNDGLYMSENISLYQFWLAAGFGEQMYYLPETGTYVMAETDGEVLRVNQIFGKQPVDMMRLAAAFGGNIREVVLGYTPAHKDGFLVREHKEEDCTLFILGEDLERIERETMMFPVLSHA